MIQCIPVALGTNPRNLVFRYATKQIQCPEGAGSTVHLWGGRAHKLQKTSAVAEVHLGRPQNEIASQVRLELESLTVMWHAAVSLRAVVQSMQGVRRVIQNFSLFDVISGRAEQIPSPECKGFL